jgi:serine/threonine protein kinase
VHGDLKPGNVMVTEGKAVILDFGFAQERARAARRPGAPPDGGTPNYMSPERLRSGGASADDDVYALALTLWEMWTCKVPEPGAKPRSKPMRQQIMFDVPSGLSDRRGQADLPRHERRSGDAAAGAAHALLQPDAAHDEPDPGAARAPRSGAAAGPRAGESVQPGLPGAARHVRHQRAEIVGQVLALDKPQR